MKAMICCFVLAAIPGVICYSTTTSFVQQEEQAGKILEIRSPAYLLEDLDAQPIRLDPIKDRNRTLYVGERVRCDRGGYLRYIEDGKEKHIRGKSDWHLIQLATPEIYERPGNQALNISKARQPAMARAHFGAQNRPGSQASNMSKERQSAMMRYRAVAAEHQVSAEDHAAGTAHARLEARHAKPTAKKAAKSAGAKAAGSHK